MTFQKIQHLTFNIRTIRVKIAKVSKKNFKDFKKEKKTFIPFSRRFDIVLSLLGRARIFGLKSVEQSPFHSNSKFYINPRGVLGFERDILG